MLEPADPSSALVMAMPEKLTDGLGHLFAVINFEHLLARLLAVRYIHRVSSYDSLTRGDPLAVDKLFGWSNIVDNRERLLNKNCVVERRPSTNCRYASDYPLCVSLKRDSEFKRLVNIPDDNLNCDRSKRKYCDEKMKTWAGQYGSHTLFQMVPSTCHEDYRRASFDHTRSWFRNMYWNSHGLSEMLDHIRKPTVHDLDEKRLQIAVHVRRGDFLNSTNREMIADKTYSDLICASKEAADDVYESDVPTDVHIFSEGIPRNGRLSSHDVDLMEKMYVTDEGVAVEPIKHWSTLINCEGDVHVHTHIATDTVDAIHNMIAADMFIGSHSGLSAHIVDIISRGIRIVASNGLRRTYGEWTVPYHFYGNGTAIVNKMDLRRMANEMKRDGKLIGIAIRR